MNNTVSLTEYDPVWAKMFQAEAAKLHGLLPEVQIEHIGSTSIKGMPAKPSIDIIIGAVSEDEYRAVVEVLRTNRYVLEGERARHAWLCFPRTSNRMYILHVTVLGSDEWLRRRAFRDYLRLQPIEAAKYAALKLSLSVEYMDDLDAYTRGKSDYVRNVTHRAMGRH
jgi:GrpB-like predicted nucleotidyltransferase (UPF0157 family)